MPENFLERIKDTYKVRIVFNENYLPSVYEISEKIKKFSEKENIKLIDLHVYKDNGLCYAGEFAKIKFIQDKKGLESFFEEMIIPFLYDQSYFRKYKIWVKGELQHGTIGILEEYYKSKMDRENRLFFALIILSIHSNKKPHFKKFLRKIFWGKLRKIKGGYSYIGGKKIKDYPVEALLGIRKLNKDIKCLKRLEFLRLQERLKRFDFCDFLFE